MRVCKSIEGLIDLASWDTDGHDGTTVQLVRTCPTRVQFERYVAGDALARTRDPYFLAELTGTGESARRMANWPFPKTTHKGRRCAQFVAGT